MATPKKCDRARSTEPCWGYIDKTWDGDAHLWVCRGHDWSEYRKPECSIKDADGLECRGELRPKPAIGVDYMACETHRQYADTGLLVAPDGCLVKGVSHFQPKPVDLDEAARTAFWLPDETRQLVINLIARCRGADSNVSRVERSYAKTIKDLVAFVDHLKQRQPK